MRRGEGNDVEPMPNHPPPEHIPPGDIYFPLHGTGCRNGNGLRQIFGNWVAGMHLVVQMSWGVLFLHNIPALCHEAVSRHKTFLLFSSLTLSGALSAHLGQLWLCGRQAVFLGVEEVLHRGVPLALDLQHGWEEVGLKHPGTLPNAPLEVNLEHERNRRGRQPHSYVKKSFEGRCTEADRVEIYALRRGLCRSERNSWKMSFFRLNDTVEGKSSPPCFQPWRTLG